MVDVRSWMVIGKFNIFLSIYFRPVEVCKFVPSPSNQAPMQFCLKITCFWTISAEPPAIYLHLNFYWRDSLQVACRLRLFADRLYIAFISPFLHVKAIEIVILANYKNQLSVQINKHLQVCLQMTCFLPISAEPSANYLHFNLYSRKSLQMAICK